MIVKNIVVLTVVAGLAACSDTDANPSRNLATPVSAEYQRDVFNCRELANNAPVPDLRKRILTGAAVGGAVGAATADKSSDRAGTAAVGAVLIGAVAALTQKSEAKKKRAEIVQHCMIARGHNYSG